MPGVELAVFLQRELVTPHRLELRALVETLACWNITLLDGVIHHRTEDGHFKPNGGITDKGNHPFFGRFDFNRFQHSDSQSLLNLGASLGFMVCEGLRCCDCDLPNAVAPVASRAILPPPRRIASPTLVTDKVYLRGTCVSV